MIRLVTSLVLTTLGGAVGYALSDKLRNDCRICRAIVCLLQRTAFLISYRGDDVYAVCSRLREERELSRLTFLSELPSAYSSGVDMRECWQNAVLNEKLPEREADILIRLGALLGKSDTESQHAAIAGLIAETEQLSAERDVIYSKKCRIYRTAGILFGVMAGILVI